MRCEAGTGCWPVNTVFGEFAAASIGSERPGVRRNRIKIDPSREEACYHCVTRTVNGEFLFDERSKETLRRMIWKVADFCGLQVLTYAVLSNHFHVLIRVPRKCAVSDAELLRRYVVLNAERAPCEAARLAMVRAQLAENGPAAELWRNRQLALMGDLSQFMKLLKQRFSIWFNKTRGRYGTLWSERFKSVLVECNEHVLATIAAYIDLNPVRAGLTVDPKDYRFCGYSEAVAGQQAARAGLASIFSGSGWDAVQPGYRIRLFAAASSGWLGAEKIKAADLAKVMTEGGKLPLATVMLCRIRYFTHGMVLGGYAFVEEQMALNRGTILSSFRQRPEPLPPVTDWGGLSSMVKVRFPGLG